MFKKLNFKIFYLILASYHKFFETSQFEDEANSVYSGQMKHFYVCYAPFFKWEPALLFAHFLFLEYLNLFLKFHSS